MGKTYLLPTTITQLGKASSRAVKQVLQTFIFPHFSTEGIQLVSRRAKFPDDSPYLLIETETY